MMLLMLLLALTLSFSDSRPNSALSISSPAASMGEIDNSIDPIYFKSTAPQHHHYNEEATHHDETNPEETDWIRMPTSPSTNINIIKNWIGSHVEIECEATGSPPPQLQWFKGQTALTSDIEEEEEDDESESSNSIADDDDDEHRRHHHRHHHHHHRKNKALAKVRSRLVINYLLPVHEGRFTCVARSGSKVVSSVTRLVVLKKHGFRIQNYTELLETKVITHHSPRISLWAPNYLDIIGGDVVLPCRAFGNPKPTITWRFEDGQKVLSVNEDEQEMNNRISVMPDGELRIKGLLWDDMGVYTCIAENMVGEDTAETFLYPMKADNDQF